MTLNCEMVGVGPGGTRSALARLSTVDYKVNVLIDVFVKPNERAPNYRTRVTGLAAENLCGSHVLREDFARRLAAELLEKKGDCCRPFSAERFLCSTLVPPVCDGP